MESSVASAIMLKSIRPSQVEINFPRYCASSIVFLVHSFISNYSFSRGRWATHFVKLSDGSQGTSNWTAHISTLSMHYS